RSLSRHRRLRRPSCLQRFSARQVLINALTGKVRTRASPGLQLLALGTATEPFAALISGEPKPCQNLFQGQAPSVLTEKHARKPSLRFLALHASAGVGGFT